MPIIIWIHKEKPSVKAIALADALGKLGYEVAWRNAAPAPGESVPEGCTAFFLTQIEMPGSASVPLIGVEDDAATPLCSQLDDLLFFSESHALIAKRLEIRLRVAREKVELEKKYQEQVVAMAKAETAMKQREEFLSVCAHDLRSPLGLIQTSLSMVLNGKPSLAPMPAELVTRARRQAGQAIKLVNDLLDVMALEQGLKPQYEVLNMHTLLDEFYQDYRIQAQAKQISFQYKNPIPTWRILADGDRVRQLLQNLFTNALKFTEPGKNIYLSVAPFQGRRASDPPYPMIVMSLKDEGKGIPASEMQKIFDRFSQLRQNSREGGRGLGLTVAKQISTLHDGNVWVQSVEGEGSTFFALFPHVLSTAAPGVCDTSPTKVLVVEPSFQKRDLYYKQMEKWGYELNFARDGIEALTMAFYSRPGLLILTPGLKKLEEAEVVNAIRNDPEMRDTRVLLAAEAEELSQNKTEVTLFDESLPLPFSREGFESTLISMADREALPSKKAA